MARDLTSRSPRWLQWASGLVLIAAGCAQPLAAAVAEPQIPAGQSRIWFYQGYEPPFGEANYSPASIPSILANGTYVGTASAGSVFYRDVPPGHYDITIPNPADVQYQSAHFELPAGQQAFIKIVLKRGNGILPSQHWSGFSALLVPEQLAQAEVPNLAADRGNGQR
jgi:hypothetical protein